MFGRELRLPEIGLIVAFKFKIDIGTTRGNLPQILQTSQSKCTRPPPS